ncbi:MAG: sugar-binding transcriptional regulator [Terracidiphilus sp.]|jgi:DNA-binding transcriptional regulator LsrR (DeoR family)
MSRLDEIRLMAKVARMYYDQGIRQQEITERLNIHQSKVSRMLKRAREANIVRISVATPAGFFPDLEDALENRFKLKEAVVIDSDGDEERVVRDLGAAAAFYVETTIKPKMVIGISSWSRSLFSMVDTLHPSNAGADGKVVQILGGVGNASTQYQAMLLAQRLAGLIGASPVLLQAPGVVGSAEAKAVLIKDSAVELAARLFPKLDLALVGIGSLEPSALLASSGNIFSLDERRQLRRSGAVGDICFQFIDKHGQPVESPLMKRVIGIDLATLKTAPRVVGIAAGEAKIPAILASLKGRWINVLITDRRTSESLISAEVRQQ